jgi:hypothetical protein
MKGMGQRLARLEAANGPDDYLQILTIDDLVMADGPVLPWPDDVAGVRFHNGVERHRGEGEAVDAFRRLLSAEGIRGPAGALPFAIVELIVPATG